MRSTAPARRCNQVARHFHTGANTDPRVGDRRLQNRVEHREPIVRCQATFNFDGRSFEYSLERVSDGGEVIDEQEPPTSSSLRWDGRALEFIDRIDAPDDG